MFPVTDKNVAFYAAINKFLNEGGSIVEWNALSDEDQQTLISQAQQKNDDFSTADSHPGQKTNRYPSEGQLHALWFYDDMEDVQPVRPAQPQQVRTVWELAYEEGVRAERERILALIPEDLSERPAPLKPEQLRTALTYIAVEEGYRHDWWAEETDDYIASRAIVGSLSRRLRP